jgi:tetratricopeptide (TPR) repeat protein
MRRVLAAVAVTAMALSGAFTGLVEPAVARERGSRPVKQPKEVEAANAAVAAGNWAEAVTQLEAALKLRGVTPAVAAQFYGLIGFAKGNMNDDAGAMAAFEAGLAAAPGSPSVLSQRAQFYFRKNEDAKALADFRAACPGMTGPEAVICNLQMAQVLDRTKDYAGSLAATDAALAIDANQKAGYLLRARARSELKDRDGALADLEKALALDPNYFQAYRVRGMIRDGAGDLDGAGADYAKCAEINPNDQACSLLAAQVYQKKRDWPALMKAAENAARINPRSPEAVFMRGAAKQGQGDHDGAIADFSAAIDLRKNFPAAFINRGQSYNQKKDFNKAIADFEQCAFLSEDLASRCDALRSSSYIGLEDWDRAVEAAGEALRADPRSTMALNNRAVARFNQTNYEAAIVDLDKALAIDPTSAQSWGNKGLVQRRLGQAAAAKESFRKAVELGDTRSSVVQGAQ